MCRGLFYRGLICPIFFLNYGHMFQLLVLINVCVCLK